MLFGALATTTVFESCGHWFETMVWFCRENIYLFGTDFFWTIDFGWNGVVNVRWQTD